MTASENNNEIRKQVELNEEGEFQRVSGQESNKYIETSMSSRKGYNHYD